jgi:hypothetical protein
MHFESNQVRSCLSRITIRARDSCTSRAQWLDVSGRIVVVNNKDIVMTISPRARMLINQM